MTSVSSCQMVLFCLITLYNFSLYSWKLKSYLKVFLSEQILCFCLGSSWQFKPLVLHFAPHKRYGPSALGNYCLHCQTATMAGYNFKAAQKIVIIVHESYSCLLISPVEIETQKLSSMEEIPEGAQKGDENLANLHRKAMTRSGSLEPLSS